jgi:hypothetical protein
MVALLATWSPGSWWCCCAADGEPAPDTVTATTVQTGEAQGHGCCSGPEAPAPVETTPAAHGDGCCPLNSDETPSCGCIHGPADAALPAATTVVATGHDSGPDLDLLAEIPPAIVAVTAPGFLGAACRGSPQRVPARSLLSLGCLLTT